MDALSVHNAGRVLAAVAGALLLTSCTSGPGAGGRDAAEGYDPAAAVTLTWWTGQTSAVEVVAEKLAAEYHAAHPNVTIDVSPGAPTADDLLVKLSAGFAGGNYPDISYAYGNWAGDLAASGRAQDLTAWSRTREAGWEELPAAARQVATVDGRVVGVPALVDNLAVIYNKKLFDAAKLPYPAADWSWDDFRADARALTDPASTTYGTAYSVSGSEDTTSR